MFDLIFLGTSASVPAAERNHPGLLVDVGPAASWSTAERIGSELPRSGAGFRRLDRLLLTHGHFDDVLRVLGLFSTLRLRQNIDVMTIHGSPGTLDVVRMLAGFWGPLWRPASEAGADVGMTSADGCICHSRHASAI
jgi:ribonuclease Z